jgi:RNase H-like domain found in reverse transcriptase/Integrase zinc binding domain
LGHVIDDQGIVMDPHKVDEISKWKTPTNKNLLLQLIGAAGYLADNCLNLWLDSAVLSTLTGATKIWRWGPTQQCTFELMKDAIQKYRNLHRTSLDYNVNPDTKPVNLVIDACQTGGGGIITQGIYPNVNIIAFWSGKFNSAQQNYPVHECKLLAMVESMKRYRYLLTGIFFYVYTNHKPIEYLMKQRNLSARQQQWVDVFSDFSFEVRYIPGESNVFADALSCIYSNKTAMMVRAESEHAHEIDVPDMPTSLQHLSRPLLTGPEARSAIDLQISVITRSKQVEDTHSTTNKGPHSSPTRASGAIPPQRWIATRRYDNTGMMGGVAVLPMTKSARAQLSRPSRPRVKVSTVLPSITKAWSKAGQRSNENEGAKPSASCHMTPPPEQPRSAIAQLAQSPDTDTVAPGESAENMTMPRPDTPWEQQSDERESYVPPPFAEVVSLMHPHVKFPECLHTLYDRDDFFKKILDDISAYPTFSVQDNLIYLSDKGESLLCIPNGEIEGTSIRETVLSHVHSFLGHLSARKTFHYIRANIWWLGLYQDVADYCASCHTCATAKPRNQKAHGLLKPLPVPHRRWQQIGIDFVGPLPGSKNRHGEFDMICVVIDHITSLVHILPS